MMLPQLVVVWFGLASQCFYWTMPKKIKDTMDTTALQNLLVQRQTAIKTGNGAAASPASWERESDKTGARYADGSFTYTLDDNGVISIHETFNEIGSRVWDTAICMGKYVEHTFGKGHFAGKKVLEVGSGTGLLGLIVANLGGNVTLTDRAALIPCLNDNAKLNDIVTTVNGGSITIKELNWETTDFDAFKDESYDYILGSDVTIVSQHAPHLVNVLNTLSTGGTRIILGSVGQREGYAPFLDIASQYFDHTDIPGTAMHPEYTTDRISIVEIHKRAAT